MPQPLLPFRHHHDHPSVINCEATRCHELLGSIFPIGKELIIAFKPVHREKQKLIMRNWLMGLQRQRSPMIVYKLETQESNKIGKREQTPSSFTFCSMQVLSELNDAYPHQEGQSTSLSPTVQMLTHPETTSQTHPEITCNQGTHCGPVKTTYKSNHHPFNLVLDFLHILAFEIYNISISDAPIHGSFARKASEINGLFVEKERIKEYKSKPEHEMQVIALLTQNYQLVNKTEVRRSLEHHEWNDEHDMFPSVPMMRNSSQLRFQSKTQDINQRVMPIPRIKQCLSLIKQISKYGPRSSISVSITWELITNAKSQAPSQTY